MRNLAGIEAIFFAISVLLIVCGIDFGHMFTKKKGVKKVPGTIEIKNPYVAAIVAIIIVVIVYVAAGWLAGLIALLILGGAYYKGIIKK